MELFIAFRYLVTKHKEAFIGVINAFSLIGITLGVATLIIVISIMNGYRDELMGKILGFKGHIAITTTSSNLKNWKDIVEEISKKIPNITFIAPVVESQALVMSKNGSSGVIVRGMLQSDICKKLSIDSGWCSTKNEIILGTILWQKLGLDENNNAVKIITPQFSETMFGAIPRMKTYKVFDAFDFGMYQYNSGIVIMPLDAAQLLFQMGDMASNIEIIFDNLNVISERKKQIMEILKSNPYGNERLVVIDWQESDQGLVEALNIEKNVMFLILSLIIIIASFNIISSLILLVKDKMQSIAILRTIGMTRGSIMRIFIMCGVILGTIGTIFGTILGVLFTLNIDNIRMFLENMIGVTLFDPVIYFLSTLPATLDIIQVCSVIIMAILLSFLATLYPAWRVSSISPAEVLRY